MAKSELDDLLSLLDFQEHPQLHSTKYKDKFSIDLMKYFIDNKILSIKIEYPITCKFCSNEAEVRVDNGQKLLIDVKNPRHVYTLKKGEYEYYKINIERTGQTIAKLLEKLLVPDDKMTYEIIPHDEYFEVLYSAGEKKLSIIMLYGQLSKEIIYRMILDLAEDERGFFLLYPERNSSIIEESLPFMQGQLLGMINFTYSGLRNNLKSMNSAVRTYFELVKFEKQIGDKLLANLDQKYSNIIKKIDTNPKYLLNLISRLQIYDKQLTTWMNFEKLVKLAMNYLFPGDITLGGSQDTGKAISDSINFIRVDGKITICLIVDAKRTSNVDLKNQTTEKYENYVEVIRKNILYNPPKFCLLFIAPSFADVSDFARRFSNKCKDAYICTLDVSSFITILRLKLSFLLSSTLELRASSLESFLGKLFDIDVVSKYKTVRTHYNLETNLILQLIRKEGETESKAFTKEFEKIKDSISHS